MKSLTAAVGLALLLLLPAGVLAQSRTRRTSSSAAQKRRAGSNAAAKPDATQVNAARIKLADQIKTLSRFLYLYGRFSKDLELSDAIGAYLGELQHRGCIEGYSLARRKFAFAPTGWGEFHVRVSVRDAAQLDQAFSSVAPRQEPVETLHREVYSRVANFKSAYYRDFPDPCRA